MSYPSSGAVLPLSGSPPSEPPLSGSPPSEPPLSGSPLSGPPARSQNLPWFDDKGVANGPMAKKFIISYLSGIQSDLQRLDNSKLFDFIKVSLKPTVEAYYASALLPPFVGRGASTVAKALYDSLQMKTFVPNLIANIKDLSDAAQLGAMAGVPFGLPDKQLTIKFVQESLHFLKPNGLPDNIAKMIATILLNNRDTAMVTISPAAPWSSSTEYPVGAKAINNGVTYEKVSAPVSPSANTAGSVWKKMHSGASGGGRKTKVRRAKGRKTSRRR